MLSGVNFYRTLVVALFVFHAACGSHEEFPDLLDADASDGERSMDTSVLRDMDLDAELDLQIVFEPDAGHDAEFDVEQMTDAVRGAEHEPDVGVEARFVRTKWLSSPRVPSFKVSPGWRSISKGFASIAPRCLRGHFWSASLPVLVMDMRTGSSASKNEPIVPINVMTKSLDTLQIGSIGTERINIAPGKADSCRRPFNGKRRREERRAKLSWGDEITCADAHFARGRVFERCFGFGQLPDDIVAVETYLESEVHTAPSTWRAM